jgi:hypothetical protein
MSPMHEKPGHMRRDSGGQHLLEEKSPGLEQMNLFFPLKRFTMG